MYKQRRSEKRQMIRHIDRIFSRAIKSKENNSKQITYFEEQFQKILTACGVEFTFQKILIIPENNVYKTVDFFIDGPKIAIEIDGNAHYDSEGNLRCDDRKRMNLLLRKNKVNKFIRVKNENIFDMHYMANFLTHYKIATIRLVKYFAFNQIVYMVEQKQDIGWKRVFTYYKNDQRLVV